jgi:hypothetical protein
VSNVFSSSSDSFFDDIRTVLWTKMYLFLVRQEELVEQ